MSKNVRPIATAGGSDSLNTLARSSTISSKSSAVAMVYRKYCNLPLLFYWHTLFWWGRATSPARASSIRPDYARY